MPGRLSQVSEPMNAVRLDTAPIARERILLALDMPDVDAALTLAAAVLPWVGGVKIGKEFFSANGPAGVRRIAQLGLPIFLDLKFHDIPNTVAAAIRASLPLRPRMLNVHAFGGAAMLRAAAEAVASAPDSERPVLLAVTVLTSLDAADLTAIGILRPLPDLVEDLARSAQACGLDGAVCSPREVKRLRQVCGRDFVLVVPGVRPSWASSGDQKRVMTPAEAIDAGADYLVIGRPISGADDPAEAAERILTEVADAR